MSSFKHGVFILILLSTCGGEKTIRSSPLKNITAYTNCSQKWFDKEMLGSKTICSSGSMVSSLAMILQSSSRTINSRPVNPEVLNRYLITKNGYKEDGEINFAVLNEIGLHLVRTVSDLGTAMEYYKNDFYIVLNLNFGKNYGVLIGYKEIDNQITQYIINNPIKPSENIIDPKDITVALIFRVV
ncbi:unnamed protein product [Paramecium sonneborni]|uniref:Uncharacterized protein n=1 Tax=Paramecium sonneborni TaxID=65129 RepID=A0A8S1N8E0_9CILI|nr:unnamed protein product [Paramecium sonneborni]